MDHGAEGMHEAIQEITKAMGEPAKSLTWFQEIEENEYGVQWR